MKRQAFAQGTDHLGVRQLCFVLSCGRAHRHKHTRAHAHACKRRGEGVDFFGSLLLFFFPPVKHNAEAIKNKKQQRGPAASTQSTHRAECTAAELSTLSCKTLHRPWTRPPRRRVFLSSSGSWHRITIGREHSHGKHHKKSKKAPRSHSHTRARNDVGRRRRKRRKEKEKEEEGEEEGEELSYLMPKSSRWWSMWWRPEARREGIFSAGSAGHRARRT